MVLTLRKHMVSFCTSFPLPRRSRGENRSTGNCFLKLGLVLLLATSAPSPASADGIRWWLSSADMKSRLAEQPDIEWRSAPAAGRNVIQINADAAFQQMLGLGSSLEPATCSNLWRMSEGDRERTLERLLSPATGIGMNLMRLCVGTPDFTGDPWYSYNDLPPGETDPELKHFSIEKDRAYILPVLKLARQKNPNLLFFASPWSPPGWMKSTGTMIGGHLLPQWYSAYAEYFVRFIQAYEAEGIPIYAVTIQNEPGVDRAKEKNPKWFYPSCHWTGEQERDFIRDHLGPALRRAGLQSKIWCYDHNYNVKTRGDDPGIAYPRTILRDAQAAQFVGGVAFHGYAGGPEGMSEFHREFPQVPLYFTEGSVFGLRGGVELIEKLRNRASGYNAWVTILDDNGKPNNGPFDASRTLITLNPATRKPTEHFDFFLYGHFMKFIQRGAVRVDSNSPRSVPNVAFRNPDGNLVLIVANAGGSEQKFALATAGRSVSTTLPARSVGTYLWRQPGQAAVPPASAIDEPARK
jgi:O-glycosyl hydrolase